MSGLGRAVVADRIASLIRCGLVEEGDLAASTGGRAPHHVRFRSSAGYLLACSLGITKLGVALVDLGGRLQVEHHEPWDPVRTAEETVDRIEALFDWMLEEHPEARGTWGIGVGLPGIVELPEGELSDKPVLHLMPDWQSYPVVERLRARFGAPVWIDNETRLMAIGELDSGRATGTRELLFVKMGTGISAALFSRGRIVRGARGFAGDIGHLAVSDDMSVVCRCGNTGCLEALAGGSAIARQAQQAAADGRSPLLADRLANGSEITAAHVASAANMGDQFCIELLTRSGRLVGETIAALVNAANPSMVVIGGGVAQAGEILLRAIREAIYRRSRSLATQDLQIIRAELGRTAGLVGAGVAVADELFAPAYLPTWVGHGTPRRRDATGATDSRPDRISRPTDASSRPQASTAGLSRLSDREGEA